VVILSDEWYRWAEDVAVDVPAEFARLSAIIDDSVAMAMNAKSDFELSMQKSASSEDGASHASHISPV